MKSQNNKNAVQLLIYTLADIKLNCTSGAIRA